jgi:hypothetical protein
MSETSPIRRSGCPDHDREVAIATGTSGREGTRLSTSTVCAFPVKLNAEEPNIKLAHIISLDHARYAAT